MLITMATYDTKENGRTEMTERTLMSLRDTVDFYARHRLMVSDNGSCERTRAILKFFQEEGTIEQVFWSGENLGTAKALNRCWRERKPGEHVCKVDNDVVIHREGWADLMETVFERMPKVGICALKRRDLAEWPLRSESFYKSRLKPVPHEQGEPWLIVEEVNHCMGTCQAFRPELLDRIGYLYQPGLYGFDDSLAAVRCHVAGFRSVFLHGVEIDHIDPGGTDFTVWKQVQAARDMAEFQKLRQEYQSGERSIYYDGGFDDST